MPLTLDGLLYTPIRSYHYETQKADSCPLYLTRPAFQQLAPTMGWKNLVPERITKTETWVGWSQWASTNFPKHPNIENHGTNIEEHSKTHRCWNLEPGEWFSQNSASEKPPQVVLYSLVGIIGGMAYSPFYDTNENLFSKLSPGCTEWCIWVSTKCQHLLWESLATLW